jgi:tellurite methyltransferase
MDNSTRYAPPEGYYESTSNRAVSHFLIDAIKLLEPKANKTALDFGCGAGSETRLLLEEGFNVSAVDGNSEAGKYIKRLPHQDRLEFICSPFEGFVFKNYDLINSTRSLPFVHKEYFDKLMESLLGSLNFGGVFVGELYGVNDEWNKPGETMTFVTKEKIEILFKELRIVKLVENEEDGAIASGKLKHWHRFYVTAKKP